MKAGKKLVIFMVMGSKIPIEIKNDWGKISLQPIVIPFNKILPFGSGCT
jgi:hypothetical protein